MLKSRNTEFIRLFFVVSHIVHLSHINSLSCDKGPFRIMNLGCNYYGSVIVDDYSRFIWTLFIATKDEAYHAFKRFAKVIQNEKNCGITSIKSDDGGEFQNERFDKFCNKFGIKHNLFSTKDSTKEWSSRKEESVFGGTSKDTIERN